MLRSLFACFAGLAAAVSSAATLDQIHIRDPFILADPASRTYYLYAQTDNRIGNPNPHQGVEVYQSRDLADWTGPTLVFDREKFFPPGKMTWAPEVHRFDGQYYLFVTMERPGRTAAEGCRGTWILKSDNPTGSFVPVNDKKESATPLGETALDGSPWIDDAGRHWLVYCHEWIQTGDGEMRALPMKSDWSAPDGESLLLFRASHLPWIRPSEKGHFITDGPFLWKSANGQLWMLWSTFSKDSGYAMAFARSESGKVQGPWIQPEKPLLANDGGHGMIFKAFDGRTLLVYHRPNVVPRERANFLVLHDQDNMKGPPTKPDERQGEPRWPAEKAAAWLERTGWLAGCNYLPANAINQLEMWQADTFDPAQIDKELAWAESLGFNSMRVFLHHLLWEQDSQGFLNRMEQFLTIADRHKIGATFVLFDSCWDPNPKLGKQREPQNGVHNSGWLQTPGAADLKNPERRKLLEAYVKGVVGRFRDDRRVHAWDIWNEPDNTNDSSYGEKNLKQEPPGKQALVAALLPKAFGWARSVHPSQPLTSGLWLGPKLDPAKLIPIERIQLEQSDVLSFHNYDGLTGIKKWIDHLGKQGRPILCTEYMKRPESRFDPILGYLKEKKVAAYNWGFVAGKSNTNFAWSTWQKPDPSDEPAVWFHDLLRRDGTPFDPAETAYIRRVMGKTAQKPATTTSSARPNIIFFLSDDMGYGDPGCYGGKIAPTPNIDRLAAEGTRFCQFTVASPLCSPSRTACTTGNFPARWRLTSYLQTREGNRACKQADFLDSKAPSVARQLKAAGYATGHFGKWHMGGGRDVTDAPPITAYGFDEYASTWESPDPHPDLTATHWIWSAQDKVKRWERSRFFVDKTLDFLRRHKDRPCYINLWPDDVHTPWVPSADAKKGDTVENLRGVLVEYDRQVGRLMAGLKELRIDDRTLVVFTSDNGPLPTFNGDRAAGLRGSKTSLYEGGVREPFIVRWPGQVPAGRVDEQSVLNAVDLLPTFCGLARAPLPAGAAIDGEDVRAALFGKPFTRSKPLFWEYGRNEKSFHYPKGRDRSPNVAVRDGNWKVLINADGSGGELYDLAADRNETNNLAEKEPAVIKRFSEAALKWRRSMP